MALRMRPSPSYTYPVWDGTTAGCGRDQGAGRGSGDVVGAGDQGFPAVGVIAGVGDVAAAVSSLLLHLPHLAQRVADRDGGQVAAAGQLSLLGGVGRRGAADRIGPGVYGGAAGRVAGGPD